MSRKKIEGFDILSPDGFSIERDGFYKNMKAAKAAFNKWKKNFEKQGYYSSNNGRIALVDLEECCTLVKVVI